MDSVEDKPSLELNGEDSGIVLRAHRQKLLPRTATVTRAHISLDECVEQSEFQKRRTQFLAGNYIGAWNLSEAAKMEGERGEAIMFLADPKPANQQVPSRAETMGKDKKAESGDKSQGASKSIVGEDNDDDGYEDKREHRDSKYDRK